MAVNRSLVWKNVAQSITSAGVNMTFQVEDDPLGMFDVATSATRLVVPALFNGRYGRAAASYHSTQGTNEIGLRKNGANYRGNGRRNAFSAGGTGTKAVSASVPMATSDYFEAAAWSSSTANTSNSNRCWCEVTVQSVTFSGALVDKSAGQAISAGVDTALTWDQEVYDLNSFHDNVTDNTKLVVPSGVSLVRVIGNVEAPAASSQQLLLAATINGNVPLAGSVYGLPVSDNQFSSSFTRYENVFSAPIAVTPGDYFELYVNLASAQTIPAGNNTWFAIEVLPAALKHAIVHKSSDQSVSTGTNTLLTWDTEAVDVGGWHDNAVNNERLTVPAGVNFVRVSANVTGASQSSQLVCDILMNGASAAGTVVVDTDTAGQDFINLATAVIPVVAGDYFTFNIFSASGRAITANVATWFAIEEVKADADISPSSGGSAGGTAVTITGVGFTSATGVTFDGVSATSFVVVNDTTITCVVPAHAVGVVAVVVQHPGGNIDVSPFEYTTNPEARITHVPVLVLDANSQQVRVTQLPILVLATPVQPVRVTHAPVLAVHQVKPLPIPAPIVPEIPVVEVWQWRTVLNIAEKGTEQRSAIRAHPRVSMSFNALILNDTDRREVYQMLFDYIDRNFTYPLYVHSTRLTAASLTGATKLFFDPAATDMRAGEAISLFDPHLVKTVLATIATVDVDGATLTAPLAYDVPAYWLVAPAPTFHMKQTVGLQMTSIAGGFSLQLDAAQQRSVMRPNQSTGLLTLLDGMLLLDKRPLADEDVDENLNQDVTWLDNDINTPQPNTLWPIPYISGQREYLVHRPSGLDYWRAVGDNLKGRQKAFLLPTFRDDLVLSVQPALSATVIRSSTISFFSFWRSKAYRYLRIQSKAGVIFRRILDVTANYDIATGDPVTIDIKLSSSIGGGAGANEISMISFVNTCRLDSDEITLEHGAVDTIISIKTRTIEE